jgi:gluconolactonase
MTRSKHRRPGYPIYSGLLTFAALLLASGSALGDGDERRSIGRIERLDTALDGLVPRDAKMEVLCAGLAWTEGPVWVRDGGFLLFSEIPNNALIRWDRAAGCRVFLKPAGYTGAAPRGGESGSNGLVLDHDGRLILCQHGDRRVARLDAPWDDPQPNFVTLADRFDGKRLNSPNDAVVHSSGAIYFTDPPYGLEKNVDDPAKELGFQGVYRIAPEGGLMLVSKELERPNGIALSPDEKTLYVANSHGPRPILMAFSVKDEGTLGEGREFFSARQLAKRYDGSCDGMALDQRGNLFATVPGGVAVIAPDGRHLGMLLTGKRTSNCTFGEEGSTLFITADDSLLRIELSTKGLGF